ncbi:DUF4810 domain-containing protein [Denitrificimonas caeni]|uniref:DUF4810 domain-containing protein n=1 Tax=Denitrificimonas caeni TaxID=521720 RepID=UPI0019630235|nr:DUF4810 domain-containing protein [Denitrificimonas caeni]
MIKLLFSVVIIVVGLQGCVQKPATLYEWGGYQSSIYSYLVPSNEDAQAQIASLEKTIDTAQSKDSRTAPGLHAHLALLYFNVGRDEEGVGHLLTEKQLFPEATEFVNFMLEKQGLLP